MKEVDHQVGNDPLADLVADSGVLRNQVPLAPVKAGQWSKPKNNVNNVGNNDKNIVRN